MATKNCSVIAIVTTVGGRN